MTTFNAMQPPSRLLGACLCLGAACTGMRPAHESPPPRPNVVLMVVDTLRADHVGAYGSPVPTPAMDAMAEKGVRFDAAYAHAPMTAPSHASMFTGRMPREHGVLNNGQPFDPSEATLAEALRARGYRTAAFVSLEVMSQRFGWARGFDTYGESFERGWWRTADEVNTDVLPWIEDHAAEPFFLFVHYSDPHEPYLPPDRAPPFRVQREDVAGGKPLFEGEADGLWSNLSMRLEPGPSRLVLRRGGSRAHWPLRVTALDAPEGITAELGEGFEGDALPAGALEGRISVTSTRARTEEVALRLAIRPELPPDDRRRHYAEEVAYVDRAIGAVCSALEAQGVSDRTLLVLTSDHGEMLGERKEGRFGHVQELYEELIRVPWIMTYPRGVPARQVEPSPVRHVDLAPTILHFVQGAELTSARGSPAWPPHGLGDRPVVAETHPPQARARKWAVRLGAQKVIHDASADRTEVFHLGLSPGEKRTIDRLATDVMEEAGGDVEAPRPRTHELSDRDREVLRALGYAE